MLTFLRCTVLFCVVSLSVAALGDAALGDEEPSSGTADEKRVVEKESTDKKSEKPKAGSPKKQGGNKKQAADDSKQAAEKSAKNVKPAKQPAKPAKGRKDSADVEREEAALLLVREHHPDLVELLKRLKGTKQTEYQQAIKELYRDSQRLEAARRDPERYELELRAWQLDSRIRLLTAKLSIEDRPEQQEDLKAALAERAEVRLAQKKLEHDRLTARIKKLNEEIDSFAATRNDELNRSFDRLLRAAKKARPKSKAVEEEKPSTAPEQVDTSTQSRVGQAREASAGPP